MLLPGRVPRPVVGGCQLMPVIPPSLADNPPMNRSAAASAAARRHSAGKFIARTRGPGTRFHPATRRSRSAFPTTETELKLIAAAAMMGLSSRPNTG